MTVIDRWEFALVVAQNPAPPWVLVLVAAVAAASTWFAARVAARAQRDTKQAEVKSAEVVGAFEAYDELTTHNRETIARLESANERLSAELTVCQSDRLDLRGQLQDMTRERDSALRKLARCEAQLSTSG